MKWWNCFHLSNYYFLLRLYIRPRCKARISSIAKISPNDDFFISTFFWYFVRNVAFLCVQPFRERLFLRQKKFTGFTWWGATFCRVVVLEKYSFFFFEKSVSTLGQKFADFERDILWEKMSSQNDLSGIKFGQKKRRLERKEDCGTF